MNLSVGFAACTARPPPVQNLPPGPFEFNGPNGRFGIVGDPDMERTNLPIQIERPGRTFRSRRRPGGRGPEPEREAHPSRVDVRAVQIQRPEREVRSRPRPGGGGSEPRAFRPSRGGGSKSTAEQEVRAVRIERPLQLASARAVCSEPPPPGRHINRFSRRRPRSGLRTCELTPL